MIFRVIDIVIFIFSFELKHFQQFFCSRIQVFHCFLAADQGGENLLVDGFSVAKQFRDRHPEGYKFLSETAIPSEYIDKGRHHLSLDTIFKHNPATGRIKQFRFVLIFLFIFLIGVCCIK